MQFLKCHYFWVLRSFGSLCCFMLYRKWGSYGSQSQYLFVHQDGEKSFLAPLSFLHWEWYICWCLRWMLGWICNRKPITWKMCCPYPWLITKLPFLLSPTTMNNIKLKYSSVLRCALPFNRASFGPYASSIRACLLITGLLIP